LSMGYLLGTYLFKLTGNWEYIYIIGLIMGNIYIYMNTNLIREGFQKTKFFKPTLKSNLSLYIASLLKNSIQQADKLLLLPLLGPKNVAIYYSSTIIGRMISMFIAPMNSVILSYLVREEEKKSFKSHIIIIFIISIPAYIGILIVAPHFLKVFYSDWASESISLLKITAGIAIITVISSLLQPFNLRYNKLKWQLYINVSYLIVYLLLAYYLTSYYVSIFLFFILFFFYFVFVL